MNQVAPLRKVPIHRSLIRPILLGGAERELVIINMTFVIALIFGVGLTKLTIISALLMAIVGQFVLVQMGKRDPMMSRVYLRHIKYNDFYPAHGSRLSRTPIIHSLIKTG
jgi:type IV secretory pathway TrbD component